MKCPKCSKPIEIVRETDWDNLVTYMWLHCFYCGWHSEQPFTNKAQINNFLKEINND